MCRLHCAVAETSGCVSPNAFGQHPSYVDLTGNPFDPHAADPARMAFRPPESRWSTPTVESCGPPNCHGYLAGRLEDWNPAQQIEVQAVAGTPAAAYPIAHGPGPHLSLGSLS